MMRFFGLAEAFPCGKFQVDPDAWLWNVSNTGCVSGLPFGYYLIQLGKTRNFRLAWAWGATSLSSVRVVRFRRPTLGTTVGN